MKKIAIVIILLLSLASACIIIQPPAPTPTPTPAPGPTPYTNSSIQVLAQHNNSPWSGQLNYTISGPSARSGYSVPETFSSLHAGAYTIMFNSGGPSGSNMTSISPSPTEVLSSGSSITFTFHFRGNSPAPAPTGGSASVSATLNGEPWNGPISFNLTQYAVSGPIEAPGYSVPSTVGNLPTGNIQLNYISGGPSGASLTSISPSKQQYLVSGGFLSYVMNFQSRLLQ
jgi:hypothetical protein